MKDEDATMYSPANETAARVVVYFGPYLFWGTVGLIGCGIVLLA